MKKLFIVANWKSNKTIVETEKWLHDFHEELKRNPFSLENKEVIVSPSFTLLEHAKYCLTNLKLTIKLSGQTISPFEEGAYTGEINGKQIKEFADYVIVGHSERRSNFYENNNLVSQKIDQGFKHGLVPVLCISSLDQAKSSRFAARRAKLKVNGHKVIVAYEPLFAIGSGHPDTPENASEFAKNIKKELGEIPVLYGGSVTSINVKSFTSMSHIDGVLVGGASLDPLEFLKIIKNA